MQEVKNRILNFFVKYPSHLFKSRELARRLQMTEEKEYAKLCRALHELHSDKMIRQTKGKKYGFKPVDDVRREGILSVNRRGYGLVTLDNGEEVYIAPRNLATAFDGDRVEIILFARPSKKNQREGITLEGEVLKVISRSNREIVGIFKKTRNFYIVEPDDPRLGRDIYIPKAASKGAVQGDKVVAVLDEWEDPLLNPEGRIVKVLGKAGNVNVELQSVALQFNIPLEFPKNVLKEAERHPERIPKKELGKRLDIRHLPVITIDPDDAKDFDDALTLEPTKEGNYRLGVHIADVSYYVEEGSATDIEAYNRGTSVYLVNGVIPMLPQRLSNDLCSLKPSLDRLAFSVFATVSPRGVVKDYDIRETVINSKRRFTYEEAEDIINGGEGEHDDLIKGLHKLSRALLQKRLKEGSLDFDTAEVRFRLDENDKPIEIVKKTRLESHRLVEECMLLANKVVARHVGSNLPFMYRIHEAPAREKLKELALFVSQFGYTFNTNGTVSKSLQNLLDEVRDSAEENIINDIALRSMMKAVYSEENVGHFGLGFRHYTHFTSPIRRYPDLIVHRLLKKYGMKPGGMKIKNRKEHRNRLAQIAEHSSVMEQRAVSAERDSVKVMQVEYMKRHVGDEFEGIISGVVNYGIFVELTETLVEGMVHVRNMEDDYYTYDQDNYTLVGKRKGRRLRLGDRVGVRVISVDPERREIDFMLSDK